MTFILRFASTAEPNSWTVRRPVMRALLRREAPPSSAPRRERLTPDGDRIDWISDTPGLTTHLVSIISFSRGGQFPSDDLPVQASLTLG